MSETAHLAQVAPRGNPFAIPELTLWATASVTTVTVVSWVLIGTPAHTRDIAVPVFVVGAGAMFGLGLADMVRGHDARFSRALIVSGVLWSLSALGASDRELAYSVGHVSQWCVSLAVAYLLLSYPSGRLADRSARNTFAAGGCLLGLLFLPTLLVGQFPHPALWSACTSLCPPNAFSLTHSTPAVIADVLLPLRAVLTVALFSVIAARLVRRARDAEHLLGQVYAPVAALAVFVALMFALYFPLRAFAPDSGAVSDVGWIFVLSLPAIGLACGTGRLYRRIHAANVLEQVARNLADSSSPADIRSGLADALQDPSLRILHSFPGDDRAWVDESGHPVPLERAAASQRITEISSGNWRIAVVHDALLTEEDPSLLLSAGSYALAAMENHCLTDELNDALHELAASRASRLTVEHDTRQKIERDLHDGAQQRLVALRVKLGLAASTLLDRDPAGAAALLALEKDVDATIDEVRSLAQGIYPPLLARTGLGEALRVAGRSAALPTTVRTDRVGRYSAEIETTVYFSCSEALQNAAKHAAATSVTISIWQDRLLHFEVRDDGAGFDLQTTPLGTGLSNLRDRLAAVGGTLTLESAPGQGTVVGGSIPLA